MNFFYIELIECIKLRMYDPRPVLENSLPNINITNYIERYPTARNVLKFADSCNDKLNKKLYDACVLKHVY